MSERLGQGIENIRGRRRWSAEVILFSVLLAALVNALITCFFNAINPASECSDFWWFWTTVCFILTAVFAAGAAWYLLARGDTETSGFQLLLPVHVDRKKRLFEIPEVEPKSYDPAHRMRDLLSRAKRGLDEEFLNHWPGGNPFSDTSFKPGHHCWDLLEKLVEALLVVFLKIYGDHTRGEAPYHHPEFRRYVSSGLIGEDFKVPLSPLFDSNPFLAARGTQLITLPFKGSFSREPSPHFEYVGLNRKELCLKVLNSRFTFCIDYRWSLMHDGAQKTKILSAFENGRAENMALIVIPIEMCLEFKPLANFRRTEGAYEWFQRLISNASRRMSLAAFLERIDEGNVGRSAERF